MKDWASGVVEFGPGYKVPEGKGGAVTRWKKTW